MADVVSNLAPSELRDPENKHSPPKSYADAVQDGTPAVNATNGWDKESDTSGPGGATDIFEHGPIRPKSPQPKILRIVTADSQDKEDTRPQNDTQESPPAYPGKGPEDAPRSPSDHTSRAPGSQKSNGIRTKNKKKGDKTTRETHKPSKKEGFASGKIAGQRWQTSPIRWAPLNVPLQRRLQTLTVLVHTLSIAIGVSMFWFLCAIPLFWPIIIPYLIYLLASKASTSGTLVHRSEFLRRLPVWSLFASYFPARLHRTQELPPTRKYIFGYHPHGILSLGAFCGFATEALGFSQLFPGIVNTVLTLDANFRIPLYRDYLLALGIASVSKESCENLLSKGGPNNEGMGRGITIVIGGAHESLGAQPHTMRLVLKRRKGFVKMAIRTGADLVPVLSFGENDLYDQSTSESHPTIHKIQLLMKKVFGFTVPLFHARGVFNYDVGLMPYRRPVNIVVGKPIQVIQASKPSPEEVDRVHELYIQELERLWDSHKDEFAPNREEEIEMLE